MAMRCNIDQKGKFRRLIGGLAMMLFSVVAWVLYFMQAGDWLLFPAVLCGILGGFMIFESRRGWCVLRAMGVKTPW